MKERHTLIFHALRLAKKIQNVMGSSPFPFSLNYSQASTILFINEDNEVNQSKLATHLHLRPSSIVTLIDELEKLNLVKRKNVNNDRRKYYLFLTEKGKETVGRIKNLTYKLDDFLVNMISPKEAANFHKTIEKLTAYLDQWGEVRSEISTTK